MPNIAFFPSLLQYLFILAIVISPYFSNGQGNDLNIHAPEHLVGQDTLSGTVTFDSLNGETAVQFITNKDTVLESINFHNGKAKFNFPAPHSNKVTLGFPEFDAKVTHNFRNWPSWISIIPPLLAILLALVLREVIISLFTGIIAGLLFIKGFTFTGFVNALLRFVDTYLLDVLSSQSHLSIIIFSLLIGGMVSLISANGGMLGLVAYLKKWARSSRRTQFVTWLTGLAIFFDDYANTLIVGNTMRPISDRFRISREKLAYLVDSTAAPIASVAFITTWIGAQLDYIQNASSGLPIQESAYSIFFNSLSYAFYPVFALAFIVLLIGFNRDFGPMYQAEIRERRGEKKSNPDNANNSEEQKEGFALDALLPLLALIITAFGALLYTGYDVATWQSTSAGLPVKIASTIGKADAYKALLWASMVALLIAFLLSTIRRTLSLSNAIERVTDGFKSMLGALMILVLAWSLAEVTEALNTAKFLAQLFTGNIPPFLFPGLIFVLAAAVSFSTGSSWGTMAILYPLVLPVTYEASSAAGMTHHDIMPLFYHVVSVVLAGSVMGDHCSPLSDTTILSSLAAKCDHIQHVRTQLPYALTVGFTSLLVGHLLTALGWLSPFIAFPLGIGVLAVTIRYLLGKPIPSFK